ncbi:FecR family protein [Algoriphagus vanfongensis]|uniref:FecR family protein n=1 Tax=Algoriphagus vanfongensis TaxID=426371 RepID=UPI000419DD88|nr:FecR domain-containing protein [Algoriphagus vanfongensis]
MNYDRKVREFYEGKLSKEEASEFLKFLESKEAEKHVSSELIRLWISQLKEDEYAWNREDLWQKLDPKKQTKPITTVGKQRWLQGSASAWLRAAVVILVVGLGALFVLETQRAPDFPASETLQENFITKSNPKGQKTKIVLDDGSAVYLNSQSSITFPADFKTNRSIRLQGEAFFEVVKDPNHPFEVEANGIITTALGTSFNISTFQKDEQVAVTLVTGKVKLNQQGRNQFIELNPGEESLLSLQGDTLEKYQVAVSDRILWTEGVLKFEETSFEDMVAVLERWYDVSIMVSGKPKPLRASGVFDRQESLRNVLNVMSKTLEFEFEIEDQSITIHFN